MADENKKRTTVNLDVEVFRIGTRLASRDRRSFSNYLEVLIEEDHRKRVGTEADLQEVAQ